VIDMRRPPRFARIIAQHSLLLMPIELGHLKCHPERLG
jgi:hypothetical protein